MPSRNDVIEFIHSLTGGIPVFVISALGIWRDLKLGVWETRSENQIVSDEAIKGEVSSTLLKDKSMFDKFWRALPTQHKEALLLSTVLSKTKEKGTPLSKNQIQKIINTCFGKELDSASRVGLLSENKLIKSTLLQDWVQRFAFKEYSETITLIIRYLSSIDLAYANIMAEYFELFGADSNTTLQRERQQFAINSLNIMVQRVIGLILILFSIWSILYLMGVL